MKVKKGDYAWKASIEFPPDGGDERIVLSASRIDQASEKQIKVRGTIHRPRSPTQWNAGGWSPPLYFTPEDAMPTLRSPALPRQTLRRRTQRRTTTVVRRHRTVPQPATGDVDQTDSNGSGRRLLPTVRENPNG